MYLDWYIKLQRNVPIMSLTAWQKLLCSRATVSPSSFDWNGRRALLNVFDLDCSGHCPNQEFIDSVKLNFQQSSASAAIVESLIVSPCKSNETMIIQTSVSLTSYMVMFLWQHRLLLWPHITTQNTNFAEKQGLLSSAARGRLAEWM